MRVLKRIRLLIGVLIVAAIVTLAMWPEAVHCRCGDRDDGTDAGLD